jgi:hypothetical protein
MITVMWLLVKSLEYGVLKALFWYQLPWQLLAPKALVSKTQLG